MNLEVAMAEFKVRTRGNADPQGKARVYFTCHPEDFERYFDKVCEDVFRTHDCAIYYTADMSEPLDEVNIDVDLGRMNLYLVPVTFRLMNEPNRAMAVDIAYAKEKNIPILPFMMESGIDALYALPKNFGERQYLSPFSTDTTEVSYGEKLKKILEAILISDEMAKRVRAAFDAYVFLSYRKKDRRYANELMRIIHNIPGCRDIAIWYDEFLTPGESFMTNIEKAMKQSELFALLVTPNLLEDGNFVMREEYPAAKRAGMAILPTEMEKTDHGVLRDLYEEIPDCVYPSDKRFNEILLTTISKIAKTENDQDPEHNFLIGLAYLDGIDVEVDVERGIELITMAAEADLPEAMEKLYTMYDSGDRVRLDYSKALKWAERLANYYVREFGEDNEYSMMWIHNLAHTCFDVGEYAKAIELQKRALELTRKNCGGESYETISSINALAQSYLTLGNYESGLLLQQEAYDMSARVLGEGHIESLSAMAGLAQLYFDIGNIDIGIQLLEETVEKTLEYLGDKHELTLITLNNLAFAYCEIGRFTEALDISLKVYEELTKINGENHPTALTTLNNIVIIEQRLGNIDEAIEISNKVVNARKAIYGKKHPDTLRAIGNLAMVYGYSGNFEVGIPLLQEIVDPYTEIFGDNHPETIAQQSNLAFCYLNSGDLGQALSIYEKTYSASVSALGEDHPDTILTLNNLAGVYIRIGEFTRAGEMLDEAYPKAVQLLGMEHPTTLIMTTQVADLRLKAGDAEGALKLSEDAYPYFCNVFGEENPETVRCLGNIALIYSLTGRLSEAKELQAKILSLYVEIFGKTHPDTLTAANNLGYTMLLIGDFSGALEVYEETIDLCIEGLSEEHPLSIHVLSNLAGAIYQAKADANKAIELLNRAFALREKTGLLYHPDNIPLLELLATIYLNSRKINEYVDTLHKLYEICRATLGEEHPKTVKVKSILDQINAIN